MVDRIAIIASIAKKIELPPSKGVKFCKLLDQAIALGLSEIALDDAKALPAAQRDELAIAMHNNITRADAAKVAKKWEPKRPVDPRSSHKEIADDLVALLNGQRQPYSPISLSLSKARGLSAAEKAALSTLLQDIVPVSDLKKLAKSWDKRNTNLSSETRPNLVRILNSLLQGDCEPMAEGTTNKKKRKAA
jgi:DNA polymerase III gamma/tau subunit